MILRPDRLRDFARRPRDVVVGHRVPLADLAMGAECVTAYQIPRPVTPVD